MNWKKRHVKKKTPKKKNEKYDGKMENAHDKHKNTEDTIERFGSTDGGGKIMR